MGISYPFVEVELAPELGARVRQQLRAGLAKPAHVVARSALYIATHRAATSDLPRCAV
jgi:hypothetical protein